MKRALVFLAACVDVPDHPSWHADVKPILEANCVRCHRDHFRLDVLEDTAGDVEIVQGAATMAPYIAARAADHPASRLRDEQIAILERWDGERGAPRAGNRPPAMQLLDGAPEVPNAILLAYQIDDADREMVHGELRAGADLADAVTVDRSLHAGRGLAGFSTALVDEDPVRIWAILDDGAGRVAIDLGTRPRNRQAPVPPRVAVLAPLRLDILGRDAEIRFRVASDAATFTADLRATDGVTTADVALGVTGAPGAVITVPWDTRALDEGTWQLTIQLAGGGASIPDLLISHATTTETAASIRPILDDRCGACHDVDELRPGVMLDRLDDMPPVSAGEDLTDDERDRLRAWLLAGAP